MEILEHPYDRPLSELTEVHKPKKKSVRQRRREREESNRSQRESFKFLAKQLEAQIESYCGIGARPPAILTHDLHFTQGQLARTDEGGRKLPKAEAIKKLEKLHQEQSGGDNDRYTPAKYYLDRIRKQPS